MRISARDVRDRARVGSSAQSEDIERLLA